MHNPRFTIPAKHSGLKITLMMFCATTAANAATCAKYASTPMDKFMLSACPTTNAANCGTLSRRPEKTDAGATVATARGLTWCRARSCTIAAIHATTAGLTGAAMATAKP